MHFIYIAAQVPMKVTNDFMTIDWFGTKTLPKKDGRYGVGLLMNLVGHAEHASGNAQIVKRHCCGCQGENDDKGDDDSSDRYPQCRTAFAQHPHEEHNARRQTNKESFVRPAVC